MFHACFMSEWWGAGVVVCLERGADLHVAQLMPLPLTVTCFSKIQIGFTFLVPAHLGSPRQRAVKRVCVCSMQFYDERVGVFVCICLCVCRRSCRRNYARPIFTKFLCMLPTAVARSSSGSIAIRYVLPVSWMTSYLHRPLQRVTSLCRCVHVNAPAASYWLRRVVDEASAETGRVRCARGAGGGVCNALLRCRTTLSRVACTECKYAVYCYRCFVVCVSCLLEPTVSCGKTAEPIEMPPGVSTRVSPRNYVGPGSPQGRGQFSFLGRSVRCGLSSQFVDRLSADCWR